MVMLPTSSRHASGTSDDLIARLIRTAGARVASIRAWPQLRYADLTFSDSGETLLPSLASHLVIATPQTRAAIVIGGGAVETAMVATSTMFVRTAAPPFRYAWQSGHRAIFVTLNASVVASAALETGMRPPSGSDRPASIVTSDPVCTHLLQVLAEEASVPMYAAQTLLVESVASALAVRLIAQFAAMPDAAVAPVAGELTTLRFARVQDYIERHLGEAISLEDLARVAGVSRFHFARQFRARTGESPMGYLLRMRVERAKARLRDSRARVIDIAAELGFADQSHFARAFRRLVGMQPSAYARVAEDVEHGSIGDEDERLPDAQPLWAP